MQTLSERRLQTTARIAYGLPIELSHEGYHEPFEAECVDLSPGGLSLRASCLPGVGETLTCHFAAPEAKQQIEVRGEVVWAHLEGHRGGEFGVRFLDADPLTIALISEMIGEEQARARRDSEAAELDQNTTAKLAVDGTTDTFTARLLRRSSGLVTFEQDLSFLKLGRGVSAYQGDDMQRGEIASVAVRLDGTTPKLMVTLRYEPSEAPDDAHTRDEAVTAPQIESLNAKATTSHDTVPDLSAPTAEQTRQHAVTLTEFDAAFRTRGVSEDAEALPPMSTKSEFDLPSALEEAESLRPPASTDEEDEGPALFTADEPVQAKAELDLDHNADEGIDEGTDNEEVEEDDPAERYELAAARLLGERPAAIPESFETNEPTVDRCDPAVMFKVDESDADFRLPKEPSALTVAIGVVLSLLSTLRNLALPLWQQVQTKLLPNAQARFQALVSSFGPQTQGLWTKVRERSLPWMRTTLHRVTDTAHSLSQRVSGGARRRRTTGIPMTPVTAAPTVNRRSQIPAVEVKRPLARVVLIAAAVGGLGLAGYALFSAPDPHVVPVHREISAPASSTAAPLEAPTVTPTTAVDPTSALSAPAIRPSAIALPAVPTALPAPSYEAGRIAAPSYPTIERAAPVATKPLATSPAPAPAHEPAALQEGTGASTIESTVVTSNATQASKRFGAASVHGRHFTLQMSAPVNALTGSSDAGGFSVIIDGALSLDRAGPIAAAHSGVARAMILNKGDRAELTIRFRDGLSPKYQVVAKADTIELTIEE